jgi:peptidoglycan LD-endopeptidase CwlK
VWSKRSLAQLKGIHPDLRRVCDLALNLSTIDFMVIDGVRTLEEQQVHVANGASKTLNSRHLHGYAVDVAAMVGGKIRWEDAYYRPIGAAFVSASGRLRIPIVWGGTWRWKDWGHFELDRKRYPDPKR